MTQKLLSDEELRLALADFTQRVRVDTPDGYDYKTYVDFDEALSAFSTQKRLLAEDMRHELAKDSMRFAKTVRIIKRYNLVEFIKLYNHAIKEGWQDVRFPIIRDAELYEPSDIKPKAYGED